MVGRFSSRPLLSRSGCISYEALEVFLKNKFSSPFIEERLYLSYNGNISNKQSVLVPFYRGAVVFTKENIMTTKLEMFSSPFIEERLYLKHINETAV